MKDFEKFDLNKKNETVATDNTLPAQTMKEEVRELADQVLKMLPPEGAEEVLSKVIIENAGNSAFSFGDNHMEIFNTLHTCFDPEPARRKVLKAMKEYGQQERQKAIQECIDALKQDVNNVEYIEEMWSYIKDKLERLKK